MAKQEFDAGVVQVALMIRSWLGPFIEKGEMQAAKDEVSGTFGFLRTHGSAETAIIVGSHPEYEDEVIVEVLGNVGRMDNIPANEHPNVMRLMLLWNFENPGAAFAVNKEGAVAIKAALLGSTLDSEELIAALKKVSEAADHFDDHFKGEDEPITDPPEGDPNISDVLARTAKVYIENFAARMPAEMLARFQERIQSDANYRKKLLLASRHITMIFGAAGVAADKPSDGSHQQLMKVVQEAVAMGLADKEDGPQILDFIAMSLEANWEAAAEVLEVRNHENLLSMLKTIFSGIVKAIEHMTDTPTGEESAQEGEKSFDENESRELINAIKEYLNTLPKDEGEALAGRLDSSPKKLERFGAALGQIAMLLASLAIVEDEDELKKVTREVLKDSRLDDADIRRMRSYYLDNWKMIGNQLAELGDPARIERRLADFKKAFAKLPAPKEVA